MGRYLNPGGMKFQQVLNSEIYVDKTGMIAYINSVINTEQRYVCVSRPRRFGKTIAANMLAAYYGKGESRELFADRLIAGQENWDQYLNRFDVVRVVMTDFIKEGKDVREALGKMQKLVVRDLKKQYPDVDYYDTEDIIQSMSHVYEDTGNQFVIIIDEWDEAFRACKEDREGQKLYLDFLRDWLKDQEDDRACGTAKYKVKRSQRVLKNTNNGMRIWKKVILDGVVDRTIKSSWKTNNLLIIGGNYRKI